ncbi:hypothetical protein OF001_U20268 [Pseudomonas sp. OF001]|nr:hypothetical protein OF001_U20268 [Pseudomonas sp. OF001]
MFFLARLHLFFYDLFLHPYIYK